MQSKLLYGLFQYDKNTIKCGFVFPVIRKGVDLYLDQVPLLNDQVGEQAARTMTQLIDFVMWGIDPWTGDININIENNI